MTESEQILERTIALIDSIEPDTRNTALDLADELGALLDNHPNQFAVSLALALLTAQHTVRLQKEQKQQWN